MQDLISHQLVKYLENRGVEHIFGLCGHTNIAVLTALEKSSIKFINTRHEQVAAHAADGYARAKQTTAVVLSHLGPGLTNASTGVANAALDSIPMVVIAGDVPSHYYGKHPHQEVNLHADASQSEIYRPFFKRVWRVERPDLFPEIIEKAFQLAETGRPGPVLVSVPMDIFSKEVDVELFAKLKRHTKKLHTPSIDDEMATQIIEVLVAAKKPPTPCRRRRGAGRTPRPSWSSSSTTWHAGVAQPDGQGRAARRPSVDAGHDRLLGHQVHQRQVPQRRPGVRPGHPLCRSRLQLVGERIHLQLYPIKADPHRHRPERNRPQLPGRDRRRGRPEAGAQGVQPRCQKLYPQGCKNDALKAEIAANRTIFKAGLVAAQQSNAFPMRPERILADVRAVLPRDAIITTDVGWNKNGVGQQFDIYKPGSILTPGGFATMGFGAPAAIGAKIACPDRVVVSLVGDGGFGQNPAMLATAVERMCR